MRRVPNRPQKARAISSRAGGERLGASPRHDRQAVDRRTHFTNRPNRNARGANGLQDRVGAIGSNGKQQRTRCNELQRIERERRANRLGFRKDGNLLVNDPEPKPRRCDQLEQTCRQPAFCGIVGMIEQYLNGIVVSGRSSLPPQRAVEHDHGRQPLAPVDTPGRRASWRVATTSSSDT